MMHVLYYFFCSSRFLQGLKSIVRVHCSRDSSLFVRGYVVINNDDQQLKLLLQ